MIRPLFALLATIALPFVGALQHETPSTGPGATTPPASNPSTTQSAPTSAPGMSHGHGAFQGDAARARWNEVFRERTPRFNTRPNSFLERCLERLPHKGTAIDIAMGQGRNAILLAQHGLFTTGIDISDVAIDQAREHAKAANVNLTLLQDDVFTFDYGEDRWDVVSVIYFNPARPILEKFKRAVRPGGFVVIEGFGKRKKGGPPDDTKFETNELLRRFSDWDVLMYEDGDFPADWGGEGTAHVIRLLARKPGVAGRDASPAKPGDEGPSRSHSTSPSDR